MTPRATPALRRLELGAALRRLRVERDLSIEDVAAALNCSISKISRIETSARGVNLRDLRQLIALFELDDSLATSLHEIAREAKQQGWWQQRDIPATDYIGLGQRSFVGLEQSASEIREFNSGVIPGLLQTASYARASVAGSAPDLDGEGVAEVVAMRLRRQAVFDTRPAPIFEAIVDEGALWRVVGDVSVMVEQLETLATACEARRVHLRLIPFSAGAHPGANSDFIALRLPGTPSAVVIVEGLSGQTLFDNVADVERYRRIWNELLGVADDPAETPARLRAIVRRIDRGP